MIDGKTTSELNIIIESLKGHMNEKFDDVSKVLEDLTNQVKKTNGQVIGLRLWRSFLTGAVAVITSVGIPLIIYVYKIEKEYQPNVLSESEIRNIVAESIKDVLKNEYDIETF